jgi:hypothetical protein
MFTVAIPHPLLNAERLTKQRMPAIVNRCRLEMMCIMWLIRQASAKALWLAR